jgi:hypothetical protein
LRSNESFYYYCVNYGGNILKPKWFFFLNASTPYLPNKFTFVSLLLLLLLWFVWFDVNCKGFAYMGWLLLA